MKEFFEKQQEVLNKAFELYTKGHQIWVSVSPHTNLIEIEMYIDTAYFKKHKNWENRPLNILCFPCPLNKEISNIRIEYTFDDEIIFDAIMNTLKDVEEKKIATYNWDKIRDFLIWRK